MFKNILVFLIFFFFLGCGSKNSTFELNISGKTITLPIQKNDALNQNKIIEILKKSWEELKDGSSFEFSYRSVKILEKDDPLSKENNEKYKDIVSDGTTSLTHSSPTWRFFKNLDEQNGLKQLGKGKSTDFMMISGKHIKWIDIEKYLREYTLSIESVQGILQKL
jgi:hypothetical protein